MGLFDAYNEVLLGTIAQNSKSSFSFPQVMQQDETMGYIPFFVSTTLGTTSCCSFDAIAEIGPVAREFDVWLHVDGAYAGSAFICPEFRPFMNGKEVRSKLECQTAAAG